MPRAPRAVFAHRIASSFLYMVLGLGVCGAGPGSIVVDNVDVGARRAGPCGAGSGPQIQLDRADRPATACDGLNIEMTRACHCSVDWKRARPWGNSTDLTLEMPRRAQVASGARLELAYTLRHKGKAPIELDFPAGAVVYHAGTWKGGKPVEAAPCGVIGTRPDAVRLTLRPGAVVRGTLSWKAASSDGCGDLDEELRPGRYRVVFATVSGTPALIATVDVTVTRAARKVEPEDGGLKEKR